ncbi:hypothetical protein AXW37_06060 [Yersinia ruckeri]|uniref:hypothetical protein n=1 Tax=Yersinia ruckeri TaxID=29486 RepID=UPI0008FCE964|nr:hypothetical protein [Yersinia ruckeri]MCW6524223.1 hypothetical protein [Yersinia ruckeri]MCW6604716.1 hypothetical protein [Yersinia ruckeri]MDN0091008.1 hypothetical protein [Yersinia ruckeri]OIX46755.1 hypothetical protein AXW22_05825 [Yersinia ruckeri]OJB74183.1 hypothetical protein A9Q65_05805 [Yersinia ruckeri]
MKNTKHEKSLLIIMLSTAVVYSMAPPTLLAYFFQLYNLNPFSIANMPHFNPFHSDRGIPLKETFSYLLVFWLLLNGILALLCTFFYWLFIASHDK